MGELVVHGYDPTDVADLSAFTGLDPNACLQRLESYGFAEMAQAWQQASPSTPEQIRRFYEHTDLYIWELTKWHNTSAYHDYLTLLDTLISRFPPSTHPRVLDYGCGIGTTAMKLLQAGYHVTIADVPGVTLRYAEFRLLKHGWQFDVVRVEDDRPRLPRSYDVLVSFDVLEHVPQPDRLMQRLAMSLRPGGIAAIVASFFTNEEFPHHLSENTEMFASSWPIVMSGCGLDVIGPSSLFRKAGHFKTALRRLRNWLWSRTGIYVLRLPRPKRPPTKPSGESQ